MLGTRRTRTVIGAIGTAGLLFGLSLIGPSSVDAEGVTDVAGRAFGIEGDLTVTPIDPQAEIIEFEIDPEPEVSLPPEGGEFAENETLFQVDDLVAVDTLRAATQGELGNAGGALSEATADGFFLIDDIVVGDFIRGRCLDDQLDRIATTELQDVRIDGVLQDTQPEPDTEILVTDFGTVRLNVQEVLAGDVIRVTAMEINIEDYELENGDLLSGQLRVGVAECGFDVDNEVIVIDDAVPANAVQGDPDFTG